MNLLDPITVSRVFAKHRLRYVVFDNLYRGFHHESVQHLFGKIAALKLSGYRSKHQDGVLPLDSTDFVGTHVLICGDSEGENPGTPLAGFKSVALSTCDKHMLSFPPVSLIRSCVPTPVKHEKKILEMISEARAEKRDIYYNGSWTVAPETRSDPELREVLVQASFAMLWTHYASRNQHPVIAAAVVRFGVDANKRFIGFRDFVEDPGKDEEVIRTPHFSMSDLKLMIQDSLSDDGQRLCELFATAWKNRMLFSGEQAITAPVAA